MPAVSYLRPRAYQDAHPAQSDPLDEQHFIVDTMNHLQKSKDWKDTAVVLAYDDSDGWYDNQISPVVNNSQSGQDTLTGDSVCGASACASTSSSSESIHPPVTIHGDQHRNRHPEVVDQRK
jgi:phospholipase C